MRCCLTLVICLFVAGSVPADEPFVLKTGDRVVLLGGGMVEQFRRYGYLEARLTAGLGDASVPFRNLGWAGDTVRGSARTGGYQNPDGLARLLKETKELRPTVIFLGYGANESFDGDAGLPSFIADYDKLLVALEPLKARVVLLSPTPQEDLGRPFPDPDKHNAVLSNYVQAISKLATERKVRFINLYDALYSPRQADTEQLRYTTNGVTLNAFGNARVADEVARRLGMKREPWLLEVDAAGKVLTARGTKVEPLGGLRFKVTDTSPAYLCQIRHLLVKGLRPGTYALKIDGKEFWTDDAEGWGKPGTSFAQLSDVDYLAAIVARDDLFYRRWRPFNDHSRHYEFMKKDYALYDAEIAAAEAAIVRARRPRSRTYEFVPLETPK